MSRYSMSEIVSLTGINAHTLRKWEERYDLIRPSRTETNIRYYSEDDLKQLLNVDILLQNGYRISKVDAMEADEILDAVGGILENPTLETGVKALTLNMLEMNDKGFSDQLERSILLDGLVHTITNLIYPFLNHVGVLWRTNRTMPAQEHFVSNLIRQKIFTAIDQLPPVPPDAPKIMMFLLEEECHEIGLLLGYYLAKALNWRVYYLGERVPISNIPTVADIAKPNLMITLFNTTPPTEAREWLARLSGSVGIPIGFAASPWMVSQMELPGGVTYLESPDALIAYLKHYSK